MNSEVVFDIAEVWFNWWHWWPFSILLLGIVALAIVGYAICDSLPDHARRFLQRVSLIAGAGWAAALLALVGLMTFIEWVSFRRLQYQRERAELTVVEGELEIGIDDYGRTSYPYGVGGSREPFRFTVVDSHNQKHIFAWKLGGGLSLGDVIERSRRGRLRVRFVPDPKHRVERALTIEWLAPAGK